MDRASKIVDVLYPVIGLIVLVVAWEVATIVATIPRYVLPSASETARSLVSSWALLMDNAISTTVAIIAGFVLSVVLGVAFGLLMVWVRPIEKTAYPLFVGSQAIPKIALAPLFVVWFGFGLTPRVIMAFLIAFFPVVVQTVAGMRSIEPELVHVSRCMPLSRLQRFTKIRFPNALPQLFSGFKVAIALAAVGAVVGEFVGSDSGLGNVMLRALSLVNTPLLFASIVVLTVIAILLFLLVELAERLMIPWHTSQRTPSA